MIRRYAPPSVFVCILMYSNSGKFRCFTLLLHDDSARSRRTFLSSQRLDDFSRALRTLLRVGRTDGVEQRPTFVSLRACCPIYRRAPEPAIESLSEIADSKTLLRQYFIVLSPPKISTNNEGFLHTSQFFDKISITARFQGPVLIRPSLHTLPLGSAFHDFSRFI